MKAIEVSSISFHYPKGGQVLTKLSFQIQKNEIYALVGPNGAGKSTLIKVIAGLLRPIEGKVHIMGTDATGIPPEKRKVRAGILFQDPDDQIFMPTVEEDVAFGPLNMGLKETEVKKAVKTALEQVDLQGFEDRIPYRLSHGEKKRVALAGILAMNPDILLLDEPASGLDPVGRRQMMETLKKLNLTTIIASHDIEMLLELSEHVLIMNEGKASAQGLSADILTDCKLLRKNKLLEPTIVSIFEKDAINKLNDIRYD